ncbi:hypothetical protein HDU86_001107 [Geranomyces michiganensis]|nr:hypothetical protein HDU86_001107 [Geranomyces michiganensis]
MDGSFMVPTRTVTSEADVVRAALIVVNEELKETGHGISNELSGAKRSAIAGEYQHLVMSRDAANAGYVLNDFLRAYHDAMSGNMDSSRANSLASRARSIIQQRSRTVEGAEFPKVFQKGPPISQGPKRWSEVEFPQSPVSVPQQSRLVVASDLTGPLYAAYAACNRNGLSPRLKSAPKKNAQKNQMTQTIGKPINGNAVTVKTCLTCRTGAGRKKVQVPTRIEIVTGNIPELMFAVIMQKRGMDSDPEDDGGPAQKNRKTSPNSEKDPFKTAGDVLRANAREKANDEDGDQLEAPPNNSGRSKSFVSPLNPRDACNQIRADGRKALGGQGKVADDRLKNLPPQLVEVILNEILEGVAQVTWDDIVGLTLAKATIRETVVFPMQRPDIFQGLRAPAKGVLLYGPPGTGKTLIGKTIASQCNAKFFSITASSLTSKWIGDGEKLVRCLFAVARVYQPAVIFVDEIDSLLGKRKDGEHDATRRMKTEFLVQFDGCGTDAQDRILLIGATNRPQELDEAVRRRFRKKLYIPLPDSEARAKMISNRIATLDHGLSEEDIGTIVARTEGYSGSDMDGLVREASLGPIRAIADIQSVEVSDIRKVVFDDFLDALSQVKASVSAEDLNAYREFDGQYGSVSRPRS